MLELAARQVDRDLFARVGYQVWAFGLTFGWDLKLVPQDSNEAAVEMSLTETADERRAALAELALMMLRGDAYANPSDSRPEGMAFQTACRRWDGSRKKIRTVESASLALLKELSRRHDELEALWFAHYSQRS